eukprot:TRINITY_DN1900_c0_g1_i2.p1 TRINITY_DN1900_c0_g1~~TRINITY_DN1900_c0_g1_i2.p1  ORF type:complete len:871 (+),score=274.28 TRINITY_DN1900_c0_g1_i2:108-2615(+)
MNVRTPSLEKRASFSHLENSPLSASSSPTLLPFTQYPLDSHNNNDQNTSTTPDNATRESDSAERSSTRVGLTQNHSFSVSARLENMRRQKDMAQFEGTDESKLQKEIEDGGSRISSLEALQRAVEAKRLQREAKSFTETSLTQNTSSTNLLSPNSENLESQNLRLQLEKFIDTLKDFEDNLSTPKSDALFGESENRIGGLPILEPPPLKDIPSDPAFSIPQQTEKEDFQKEPFQPKELSSVFLVSKVTEKDKETETKEEVVAKESLKMLETKQEPPPSVTSLSSSPDSPPSPQTQQPQTEQLPKVVPSDIKISNPLSKKIASPKLQKEDKAKEKEKEAAKSKNKPKLEEDSDEEEDDDDSYDETDNELQEEGWEGEIIPEAPSSPSPSSPPVVQSQKPEPEPQPEPELVTPQPVPEKAEPEPEPQQQPEPNSQPKQEDLVPENEPQPKSHSSPNSLASSTTPPEARSEPPTKVKTPQQPPTLNKEEQPVQLEETQVKLHQRITPLTLPASVPDQNQGISFVSPELFPATDRRPSPTRTLSFVPPESARSQRLSVYPTTKKKTSFIANQRQRPSTISDYSITSKSGLLKSLASASTSNPNNTLPPPQHILLVDQQLVTPLEPDDFSLSSSPEFGGSPLNSLISLASFTHAVDPAAASRLLLPQVKKSGSAGDQLQMRARVFEELVRTEQDYAADMLLTSKLFYLPLKTNGLLEPKQISTLFSNLTMLLGVSHELLKDLEKEDSIDNVGSTFCFMMDFLKLYAVYCTNHPQAVRLLNLLRRTVPKFDQYLKDQQSNKLCRGSQLSGFLIKPVQRVTKYPLILKVLQSRFVIDNLTPH